MGERESKVSVQLPQPIEVLPKSPTSFIPHPKHGKNQNEEKEWDGDSQQPACTDLSSWPVASGSELTCGKPRHLAFPEFLPRLNGERCSLAKTVCKD